MTPKTALSAALLALGTAVLPAAAQTPFVFHPPVLPPPSVTLTDTNATPMETRELSVEARVDGLYATVETTLRFHNPNGRDLEGELVFPLPDGAAVCGYALDVNGDLVDGVVVPKEKARVAFETETRRRVDPGLVEYVKGNVYKTRIYPLPRGASRTVKVTYTTPLATSPAGDAALALPMPRAPLAKRHVKIEVVRRGEAAPQLGGLGDSSFAPAEQLWRVEKTEEDVTPADDLLVALPAVTGPLAMLEKSPDGTVWFCISEPAPASQVQRQRAPRHVTVLWDASASRADAPRDREFAFLRALAPCATGFDLVVFRDKPEPARSFETADDLVAAIEAVPCDGGTDLSTLPEIPEAALLFTDGLDTLSGLPVEFRGARPVAVVSQSVADRESLRQACGGRLIDLQTATADEAVALFQDPPMRISHLTGTGIAQVQGIGSEAVGRVRLLGQLTAPTATLAIAYTDGTASPVPFELDASQAVPGNVLATAWAAARVNQLAPRADDHEDELLALGRRYGLASPATSLIVLESLDQWLRYEIEPPETLPQMRADYQKAILQKISRDPADVLAGHTNQLAKLWADRVSWWKNYKKGLPKEPKHSFLAGLRNGMGIRSRSSSRDVDGMAAPDEPMMAAAPDMVMEDAMELNSMAFEERELAVHAMAAGYAPDDAGAAPAARKAGSGPRSTQNTIQIKAWSPDTPYLKALAKLGDASAGDLYAAYLAQRAEWASSPAFYLDCADAFLKAGHTAYGVRILTNLAELRLEDAALLRVLAWRLQQADELDLAIVQLRRVAKLRPEEPQSFRDLALALAERGQKNLSAADIDEACDLLRKVAFTPWNRHADSIPLFALEEINALAAWTKAQTWPDGAAPADPDLPATFKKNLDTDLRIVMSWDADNTDVDIHVVEPSGEEAYYAHNRTKKGGLVSRDITDGYGPEEYLIRKAPEGAYNVKAHYFASHQQTVTGPATVTVTVFTDWGRPTQKREVMTLRLGTQKDTVEVGTVHFGAPPPAPTAADPTGTNPFATLRPGMTRDEVASALSPLVPSNDGLYHLDSTSYRLEYSDAGTLLRVYSLLPNAPETLLVQ
jgi:hypothetical protein